MRNLLAVVLVIIAIIAVVVIPWWICYGIVYLVCAVFDLTFKIAAVWLLWLIWLLFGGGTAVTVNK